MRYSQAPAHVRAAIRQSADRWETADGTPLADLLTGDHQPESETGPAPAIDAAQWQADAAVIALCKAATWDEIRAIEAALPPRLARLVAASDQDSLGHDGPGAALADAGGRTDLAGTGGVAGDDTAPAGTETEPGPQPRITPELWRAVLEARADLMNAVGQADKERMLAANASTNARSSDTARAKARDRLTAAQARLAELEAHGYQGLLVIAQPGLTDQAKAKAWATVVADLPAEHQPAAHAVADHYQRAVAATDTPSRPGGAPATVPTDRAAVPDRGRPAEPLDLAVSAANTPTGLGL